MYHPLTSNYSESHNRQLLQQTLGGDRQALEQLLQLHQPFIYQVAWKMTHDPNDAQDLTQETLIKVMTKLAQFQFKSSFRTWLYRIVVNEFLQSKRRKGEAQFTSFEAMAQQLDGIPDATLTPDEVIEYEELSKEMQIRCLSGMLMCLNREQRLIYILGDTFGVDHQVGAEIFDCSKGNFRIKLSRARRDLYNFMNLKCGLVNKKNPCRCPKKAKSLHEMGLLSSGERQFNVGYRHQIADYVEDHYEAIADHFHDKYTDLFRSHPVNDRIDASTFIKSILGDDTLMGYFELQ